MKPKSKSKLTAAGIFASVSVVAATLQQASATPPGRGPYGDFAENDCVMAQPYFTSTPSEESAAKVEIADKNKDDSIASRVYRQCVVSANLRNGLAERVTHSCFWCGE